MSWVDEFAEELQLEPRTWQTESNHPKALTPKAIFFQQQNGELVHNGLEVILAEAKQQPKTTDVRAAWSQRWDKRAAPVLLVVGYPTVSGIKASVCSSPGENPRVFHGVEMSRALRIAKAAMAEHDHHGAIRSLHSTLPQLDPPLEWMKEGALGLNNSGLLATQELLSGVPKRQDWRAAVNSSQRLLNLRGRELVKELGFEIEVLATHVSKLTVDGEACAVALFCEENETFEAPSKRLDGFSPVSRALAEAGRDPENIIDWVVLTRGSEIRLYAAKPSVGVGHKGRGNTFVELSLLALSDDEAGYLHLLFSAAALAPEGSVDEILNNSKRFAANLAHRLRERVYKDTVPALAQAVATRIQKRSRKADLASIDLREAYEQTMFILFRLLFVAYGEANDLLPYKTSDAYNEASLTQMVLGLLEADGNFSSTSTKLWDDVLKLWDAINVGSAELGVPTYNGGLFSENIDDSPTGAELAKLSKLKDDEFGPALTSLFIDETGESPTVETDKSKGPVDFRALSVREFGTIYEGLLESQLAVADTNLVLGTKGKEKGQLVPTRRKTDVDVEAGTIYFLNRSGERKASGTYFTKPFVVEHLLDEALEPALADHVKAMNELREAGDDAGEANKFFDFKCADIAMGSGHFLVAALDRIEAQLSAYLVDHPIPEVINELERLRRAAAEEIDDKVTADDIETSSLLRRQIARHCVYGVDKNQIAVELARLSIWIHTFIPGLPLSFLDHNLVCGNSLTGVGTIDEVAALYGGRDESANENLFAGQLREFLERARESLQTLAKTSDATKEEINEAQYAHRQALEDVRPARSLFDIVTAIRDPDCKMVLPERFDESVFNAESERRSVKESVAALDPVHFPAAFPEVFLRAKPGFDVLLGNPPWEKVQVDESIWWQVHRPGLKSLSVQDRKRELVRLRQHYPELEQEYLEDFGSTKRYREFLQGVFPDIGQGHTDLFKAFSWRNFWLTRYGGYTGIVLPRTSIHSGSLKNWRLSVFEDGSFSSVLVLENKSNWVFDDVATKYNIVLIAMSKQEGEQEVNFAGPLKSIEELDEHYLHCIPTKEFLTWSTSASFPSIPQHPGALELFTKMRGHPRMGDKLPSLHSGQVRSGQVRSGQVRPYPRQELNSTTDKPRFILDGGASASSSRHWPVYKGESLDLWNPDTGKYYASADPVKITKYLQNKRERGFRRSSSVFSKFDEEIIHDSATLECYRARVAFRDITRASDSRTIIAALVPPEIVATNMVPVLLWPDGKSPKAQSEALILGLLSSMILDWYARRVVELHLTFEVFEELPNPTSVWEGSDRTALRVIEISGRLAAVDERFAEWAEEVGVPVGSANDPEVKERLIHELDACVAHLYGLDEDDLACLYETFHNHPDDHSERHQAVLELFREQPWLQGK